jgi:hypothetical protein
VGYFGHAERSPRERRTTHPIRKDSRTIDWFGQDVERIDPGQGEAAHREEDS